MAKITADTNALRFDEYQHWRLAMSLRLDVARGRFDTTEATTPRIDRAELRRIRDRSRWAKGQVAFIEADE